MEPWSFEHCIRRNNILRKNEGLFENTYNIITIDSGKINVELKIVNGERIPLYDLVKKHEITQDIE